MKFALHKSSFFRPVLVSVAVLLIWTAGDQILDHYHYGAGYHNKLQHQLLRKYGQMDRYHDLARESNWDMNTTIPAEKGILILAYHEDSMIYWSDNSIALASFNQLSRGHQRFEFLSNGWYVIREYQDDTVRSYGLYLVKSEYPYENNFLKNEFQKDLRLPRSTELLQDPAEGAFSILDWEGMYLFSVQFNREEIRFDQLEYYYSPLLFLVFIISLLLLVNRMINRLEKGRRKNSALIFLTLSFIVFRYFQYRYHFPADLYELEMFTPVPFAYSLFLPSLGDVLINAVLLLYLMIKFNRDFTLQGCAYNEKLEQPDYLFISGFLLGIAMLFVYSQFVLSNLILHSTIGFEMFNVASLNIYTFISLLIMAMHFAVLVLVFDKFFFVCKAACNFLSFLIIMLLITALWLIITLIIGAPSDVWSYLAFLLMFGLIAAMHYRRISLYNYAQLVLVIIFFSVYTVFFISHYSTRKTDANMDVLAEKLSEQHDPVAEFLLEDIHERMVQDRVFFRYLYDWNVPFEEIISHLQRNYFNGYWSKYNLSANECNPGSTVEVPPTDLVYNCYDYYNNVIEEGGIRLGETDFYYLEKRDGRIHYIGMFAYTDEATGSNGVFYLFIDSKLIAEELGYPELLLDTKYQDTELFREYSYAKFYRSQLLARSGEFRYSLNFDTYDLDPLQADNLALNTYMLDQVKFGGYEHHVYYFGGDNVIVISKPAVTFFDQLISFSYIFLFYYLLVIFFIVIRYFSRENPEIVFNFKNKIRMAIISILLLTLALVGGGTIYLSIEQYRNKQTDNLSEKIQSVYLELYNVLAYVNVLTPGWTDFGFDNLNQLLINLSDVFYSDINLYDPEGNMLATSRAEIFNQGIIGQKMDPLAYNQMAREKQSTFIHQESIGDLEFLSAYVPFVNTENSLLAFLNLPYFTKENEQRNETTTLIVAMVNIFVLLLLVTFILTIFISNQIVLPLKLIQQKFGEIKLGKMNEEIVYRRRDEIADLVDEYNRMVKELARNVEMLSKSEREIAWREMAKQVAHEIKNPLTPMKLSIQHLQRSWKDNRANFDDYLDRFAQTLIEQIDNLSFIASEFSNFAKMPRASNEDINLVEVLRSALSLFSNTEGIRITFDPPVEEMHVYVDREQLSRVFINLIKNAIQAIPENQSGSIDLGLERRGDYVRVSIADNGKGIPEDIQSKLFTPSFTTKSSGMGLGLSITKNIIESFQGHITFKTEVNAGTTFFVELPVYHREGE